jgi:hypothetical protein
MLGAMEHVLVGRRLPIACEWCVPGFMHAPGYGEGHLRFTDVAIPWSEFNYPYKQLSGVVGAKSGEDGEFGKGRSGSAWVVGSRPLAMQVAGYYRPPGTVVARLDFRHGFGQLAHNILADLRSTLFFPDLEIVHAS